MTDTYEINGVRVEHAELVGLAALGHVGALEALGEPDAATETAPVRGRSKGGNTEGTEG